MNDTSYSPLWNWKGWQFFKWVTGIVLLVIILVVIYQENVRGYGWVDRTVEEMLKK